MMSPAVRMMAVSPDRDTSLVNRNTEASSNPQLSRLETFLLRNFSQMMKCEEFHVLVAFNFYIHTYSPSCTLQYFKYKTDTIAI